MAAPKDAILGRLAVERGYLTRECLDEAFEIQRKMHDELGMDQPLEQVLTGKRWLTADQAHELRNAAAVETGEARLVAGYEAISKLGQGGMGAVYRARRVGTEELVALKVLPPSLADEEMIARFRRESEIVRRLDHENIVACVEFGFDRRRKVHFCALELVDGEDLAKRLRRVGRLPEDEAVSIASQIAMALQHAFFNGLVHRDVKPENIMVTPDGTAKLLDLGLARPASTEATRMTQSGMFVGSPYYASPEQALGEREVDARSDIYSLGATLYHMVTGRQPFEGTTALAILQKHVSEKLTWPAEVNPELSDGLCRVIAKMMEKSPDDRYQTPNDLNDDLDLLMEGEEPEVDDAALRNSSIKVPAVRPKRRVRAAGGRGRTGPRRADRRKRDSARQHRRGAGREARGKASGRSSLPAGVKIAVGAGALGLIVVTGLVIFLGGGEPDRGPPRPKPETPERQPEGVVRAPPPEPEGPQREREPPRPPGPGRRTAASAFRETEQYELAHPKDAAGAIARYEAVARDFPGTLEARKAELDLIRLRSSAEIGKAVGSAAAAPPPSVRRRSGRRRGKFVSAEATDSLAGPAELLIHYDVSDPNSWNGTVLKDLQGFGKDMTPSAAVVYVASGAGLQSRAYLDFRGLGYLGNSGRNGNMFNPIGGYTMEGYFYIASRANGLDSTNNTGIGFLQCTNRENQFIRIPKGGRNPMSVSTVDKAAGRTLDTESVDQDISGIIPRDRWFHAVKVHDSTAHEIRWYVDGALQPDLTAGLDPDGSALEYQPRTENYGNVGESGRQIKGVRYSMTRFYRGVLSAREIHANYQGIAGTAAQVARGAVDLTRGLVGHWKFDEGHGTAARDSSGKGNHGTVKGGAKWVAGKIGGALEFDGKDDSVAAGGPRLGIESMTLSAWVFIPGAIPDDYCTIFEHNRAGDNWYGLWKQKGAQVFHFRWARVGTCSVDFATGIAADRWYHLAATYDAATGLACVYIDGAPDGSRAGGTRPTPRGKSLVIGRNGKNNEPFKGLLDDVRVYDRALSAEEVKALYALGEAAKAPASAHAPVTGAVDLTRGLVGHWTFDEGTGTTARDSSGKGNHGTVKGGATWVKGRLGGALEFRGGDQHVDAGTGRSLRNGSFAVAAWVKVEAYPLRGMANIVGKYRPKSRLNNIALRPDGRARTAYYAGDWKDHVGGKPLPKNQWNHVAAVVSPPHVCIYLNGDLDGSRHDVGTLSLNDGPLVIGGEKGYWPFSGLIDDVRIYNRALSAEEVKALHREAERLAAQEASSRAQEKVQAGLESLFARVDALLEKGDHAGAKRLMESAAGAGGGAEAGPVAAAARVAEALAGRDEAIRSEAGRLLGATTELRTSKGKHSGKVEKVTDAGIVLLIEKKIPGAGAVETRMNVKWADLAPGQADELARRGGWKAGSPEAQVALAYLALGRKDTRAANAALARAGDHPVARHCRGKLEAKRRKRAYDAAMSRARSLAREESWKKTAVACEEALRARPEDPEASKLLAKARGPVAVGQVLDHNGGHPNDFGDMDLHALLDGTGLTRVAAGQRKKGCRTPRTATPTAGADDRSFLPGWLDGSTSLPDSQVNSVLSFSKYAARWGAGGLFTPIRGVSGAGSAKDTFDLTLVPSRTVGDRKIAVGAWRTHMNRDAYACVNSITIGAGPEAREFGVNVRMNLARSQWSRITVHCFRVPVVEDTAIVFNITVSYTAGMNNVSGAGVWLMFEE